MPRLLATVLGIAFLSTQLGAADSEHLAKARAEGRVAFYANMTAVEPVVSAFKDATGITAEYTRISTAKFVPVAVTEFAAGKFAADVVQGPLPVLEQLEERGMLAPYRSPAAEGYPEWSHHDDRIQLFGIEYVGLIYNKELVAPADVPKRYEDLADPKWRDKIVMPDPSSHATTIAWLIGLKENVFPNEEAWRKFLQGLAANRPMFVASFGPTPGPLESGEKVIGVSMPKYIVTRAPAPLDWARLSQPLLGTPRAIAVTSKAPHPNAAREFVDYWLTTDPAMRLLAKDVGEYVLAPGVFPPIDGIDKARVIPIRDLSDEEIRKWAAEFKTIFQTP